MGPHQQHLAEPSAFQNGSLSGLTHHNNIQSVDNLNPITPSSAQYMSSASEIFSKSEVDADTTHPAENCGSEDACISSKNSKCRRLSSSLAGGLGHERSEAEAVQDDSNRQKPRQNYETTTINSSLARRSIIYHFISEVLYPVRQGGSGPFQGPCTTSPPITDKPKISKQRTEATKSQFRSTSEQT